MEELLIDKIQEKHEEQKLEADWYFLFVDIFVLIYLSVCCLLFYKKLFAFRLLSDMDE